MQTFWLANHHLWEALVAVSFSLFLAGRRLNGRYQMGDIRWIASDGTYPMKDISDGLMQLEAPEFGFLTDSCLNRFSPYFCHSATVLWHTIQRLIPTDLQPHCARCYRHSFENFLKSIPKTSTRHPNLITSLTYPTDSIPFDWRQLNLNLLKQPLGLQWRLFTCTSTKRFLDASAWHLIQWRSLPLAKPIVNDTGRCIDQCRQSTVFAHLPMSR